MTQSSRSYCRGSGIKKKTIDTSLLSARDSRFSLTGGLEMKLKLSEMASVAEIVGAFAIVISLVYVGVQLTQNTKGIRAQSYYNVLSGKNALYRELAADEELFSTVIQGMVADPPLPSVIDGARTHLILYAFMNEFETTYLLYKADAIEEEIWLRDKAQMAGMIGFPGMRNWWSLAEQYFHRDFVAEVAATEPILPITYDPSTGKFVKSAPEDTFGFSD